MWYVCDVLYTVLYVRVNCFVVRRCFKRKVRTLSMLIVLRALVAARSMCLL